MSTTRSNQHPSARLYRGLHDLLDGSTAMSVLVFAAAYYIAYKYVTFPFGQLPSPFWAPDAVLLCAMLLAPARSWWMFIIVALPIRLLTQSQEQVSMGFLLATYGNDVLKALFSATVFRRLARASPRLAGLRDFSFFFACAVVVAPALSAFAGAATHYARSGGPYWHYWQVWFLGDALVNLVLTPTILYWWTGGPISLRNAALSRWAEALLLVAGLILILVTVLSGGIGEPSKFPVLLYVPMPFLLWAAVRFGSRGASVSLTLVALLSVWYAVQGRGPFSGQSAAQNVLSLQLFLIVVSTPLLFLAVLVQERRNVEESLRESEQRYRQMFEQNRAVQWLIDPSTGAIVAANPAASEFYGYGLEELKRMKVSDINTAQPAHLTEALRMAAAKKRESFNFRHRLASGEIRDVEVHASPADVGGRRLIYSIIHDITERRQTEERFRRFFDLPLVGMAITSPDRRFVLVNQKLSDMLGYSARELTGMTWVEVTHPDDIDENVRLLERTLSGKTDSYTMDKRFIRRDGRIVYASISARSVPRADGAVDHLVLIVQDITERKHAEAALRQSEERFSRAFQSNPQPMSITTLDEGLYVDVNQRFLDVSGYEREDVIGRTSMELKIWESAAARAEVTDPLRQRGQVRNVETRFRTKSGEIRIWLSSAELIEVGGQQCILMASSDITERMQADGALRESESKNRAVLKAIPDLMFLLSRDGVYLDYHAKDPADLLAPPEVFIGKSMRQVLPMELAVRFEKCFEQALLSDEPVVAEYSLPIGGRDRFYECRIVACGSDKVLSIVRDITERKQTEDSITESEQRFRQLADNIDSVFFILERSGSASSVIYISLAYESIWGRSCESLYRNPGSWLASVHPDDLGRIRTATTAVPAARVDQEYRIIRPDGEVRWVHERVFPIPGENGNASRLAGIVEDISDRKLADESLEQALAEVRQLKDQLYAENVYLQEAIMVAHGFGEIVGTSDALKRVLQQVEQVAPLDTTVLILGETGTGKELLAHAIHNLSARKSRPLIRVNCATLPSHLIEDELFGHEKGAFTGAVAKRVGRFEIASGGTIFLDEIGELPLDLQAKLLRVIQEGEFERLGSSRTIKVDVRLIAATNRDLEAAVRNGAFRADLFYRLSVYPITVPPLRDRRDDIPPLVMHFVKQFNAKLGKQIDSIPQRSLDALQSYPWPGNIRELSNVIERSAIVTAGNALLLLDSFGSRPIGQDASYTGAAESRLQPGLQTLEESERLLILRTLDKTFGRIEGPAGAATLLGIHPSTLRSRMRKLGIARSKTMTPSDRA